MASKSVSCPIRDGKHLELQIEALFIAALLPRSVQLDLLAWQMADVPWQEIHTQLRELLAEQQRAAHRLAA